MSGAKHFTPFRPTSLPDSAGYRSLRRKLCEEVNDDRF